MAFKPFCLHPSISTLQVISLDYVVALYPLLLIFITYFLVKIYDQSSVAQFIWKPMAWLYTRFDKECAGSISLIEVFSTFFLLSYVKVANTSLDLLMPVQVVNITGHVLGTYTYFNGSLEYFGPEHRPFALLAIIVFTIFNLVPLLLLCVYPCRCFQSCLDRCRLNSQVLRTFMDAFQGYYKFEPYDCRYFSGFYLVLRIIVLFMFFFIKSGFIVVVLGIATMIPFTALFAIARPYKKDIYNTIDLIFLLVLILVCFGGASISLCSLDRDYLLFANAMLILSLGFIPLYGLTVAMGAIVPKTVLLYLKRCLLCCISQIWN